MLNSLFDQSKFEEIFSNLTPKKEQSTKNISDKPAMVAKVFEVTSCGLIKPMEAVND